MKLVDMKQYYFLGDQNPCIWTQKYNGIDKRCDNSDNSDIVITLVVPGSPMVINMDVKVEPKSLPEEGMFNFLIQYSVKT